MEISEVISKEILKRKEELGLSRYEIERRTGISYNQITYIERGGSTTTRILSKLFDVLGLEILVVKKEDKNNGDNDAKQ